MELTFYKPSELEIWINKKYQEHDIHYAADLDLDHLSDIFQVTLKATTSESKVIWDDEFCLIFLNEHLGEEEKREHFFHEISHPMQHVGRQEQLPPAFVELQEIQASHFQLYAAMPIYIVEKYKEFSRKPSFLKVLSEEFKLSLAFVQKRIDQIKRRIYQGRMDHEFMMKGTTVPVRYNYSSETQQLLEKSKQLKAKKGVL
ncbi:ImmA/IrrE family metallo-endopeptidase [Paenibacillus sp. LMG 31456]|uniref:ImmA/IrrE family metallo-endopeptidase n=1 Tax=Paenibacillus foliorum TaxID=2654974 RepID=A0A972K290_9BACL|nr:ImmA/IrrE family metallo-endopeptidase [Paenibacillus foliorum]NOU95635.1 ImmA/IrrE family metallo-endopeptidase [Paenibacillus foliorum]